MTIKISTLRSSTRRRRRIDTVVYFVGIIFTEIAVGTIGSVVPWLTAGSNVFDGNVSLLTLTFVLCAAFSAIHAILTSRLTTLTSHALVVVAGIIFHVLVVASLVVSFVMTSTYFLGWLTAFIAAVVAVRAAVSIVIDVVASAGAPALLHLVTLAAGVIALGYTSSVWSDNGVLVGLLLFVSGFVLCGLFFNLVVRVATPQPAPSLDTKVLS